MQRLPSGSAPNGFFIPTVHSEPSGFAPIVWMFPPKSRSADFIPCALRIFIASSPAKPFPAAPKSNIIPGAAVM